MLFNVHFSIKWFKKIGFHITIITNKLQFLTHPMSRNLQPSLSKPPRRFLGQWSLGTEGKHQQLRGSWWKHQHIWLRWGESHGFLMMFEYNENIIYQYIYIYDSIMSYCFSQKPEKHRRISPTKKSQWTIVSVHLDQQSSRTIRNLLPLPGKMSNHQALFMRVGQHWTTGQLIQTEAFNGAIPHIQMQVMNDQFSHGNGDLGIPQFKQPIAPPYPRNSQKTRAKWCQVSVPHLVTFSWHSAWIEMCWWMRWWYWI